MYCHKCGKKNPVSASFCHNCGERLLHLGQEKIQPIPASPKPQKEIDPRGIKKGTLPFKNEKRPWNRDGTIALVLAFVIPIVGQVLGIIAIRRGRKQQLRGTWLATAAVVIATIYEVLLVYNYVLT